jgi:signal transduction histidine kinase
VKTFLDLAPKKMTEERGGSNGLRNPDFWNDYHHNVQQQIEKINDLLSGLSSASDTAHMPFSDKVSLREIVEEAWLPFKEPFAARKIELENKISDSLPALRVDKNKFSLLFDLLFKEELATLPSGSRVTLEAEAHDGAKGEILIRMSDNGSGLPQDALRAVFDPFVVRTPVQSEYGVHLMACFFIVHHHGGKIEAHSEPARGTTFNIHLPLHPEKVIFPPADTDFLQRAVLNEELWKKLMAT